ncbi:hypothetical protein SEA_OBLADI_89 [Gordonia phage ObLaDi]|uniref:Uncharacterized protein n=3 Tax=Cafassovirus TaxID=3425056 RepID=A0A9E7TVH5_9CAUD|nr:hypothetical protein SEA_CAFASSO_89 [Gordonia phage Cafasso]UVK59828.1 hypothetical protein SEA_ALEEMILY_88 [Gordonia phage Aleemily]UXE03812.1 hypothetical protein SEA_OBLADI_89 [Gordonia phage ObLaDi]
MNALHVRIVELRERLLDGELEGTEVHMAYDAQGLPDALVTTPSTELLREYAACYAMDIAATTGGDIDAMRVLWARYIKHVGRQWFPAVIQFSMEFMVQVMMPQREEGIAMGLTAAEVQTSQELTTVALFERTLGRIDNVDSGTP